MPQHWAVDLAEYVAADFDDQIGADAEDVVVEGGVMDLAQGEAVRDYRPAQRMEVRQDVRSVE
jgi:hypothetical protein